MLFVNNPEALMAIENDRRRELGQRSTADPDQTPIGTTFQAVNRLHPVDRRPLSSIASTGHVAR